MDRHLRVTKGGYLFADIAFDYSTQINANAKITIYKTVDAGLDMKTVIPLVTYFKEIEHLEFFTVAEIKAFDRSLLNNLPDVPTIANEVLKFTYDKIHYRYVVGDSATIAIIDIDADFEANVKEMQLHSAKRVSDDGAASSNSLEINRNFIIRICLTHSGNGPTEFISVS